MASSVATPKSVKARRRQQRRRQMIDDGRGHQSSPSMTPPPPPTVVHNQIRNSSNRQQQQRTFGEESFEEATTPITSGGEEEEELTLRCKNCEGELQGQHKLPKMYYYLMRVSAPMGLKILDAPHFQVSNLIHSPTPTKMSPSSLRNSAAYSPVGLSPFARTNAMVGSGSAYAALTITARGTNSPSIVQKNRPNNSARFLACGQIFEASQRMEVTTDVSLYTNGRGLVKLADGSGWAIVPHYEDLRKQFEQLEQLHDGDNMGNGIEAFEEIGNALTPLTHSLAGTEEPPERLSTQVSWLRIIAPPNGIKVLLPPPKQQQPIDHLHCQTHPNRSTEESADSPLELTTSSSSLTSSSFFDSVWSRVAPSNLAPPPSSSKEKRSALSMASPLIDHVHHNGNAMIGAEKLKRLEQQPMIPVIPCGMVVPVEPMNQSTGTNKKCFSRLYNGQGWIPRYLGEINYAKEVATPCVCIGSFWFRVKCRSGLYVRRGPSVEAPIIKAGGGSDNSDTPFRFECGEYLRASELITISAKGKWPFKEVAAPVECFAKLYRRHSSSNHIHPGESELSSQISLLNRFSSLQSFATPGEWVQVHGDCNGDDNEKFLLEKCTAAPTIERNHHGWQYRVTNAEGTSVYSGPSLRANQIGLIGEGQFLFVSEKVTAAEADAEEDGIHHDVTDNAAWLRLQEGGWVHSIGCDGRGVVVKQHEACHGNNGNMANIGIHDTRNSQLDHHN